MPRELEYEVIGSTDSIVGRVWWDGKKIDSDSDNLLRSLKKHQVEGYTIKSGKEFLKRLPALYKSGYLRARKVSK